jgi:signal transduction histidine kinase
VDNALKFTKSDDTVENRAFEADSEVVIKVADTESGVPHDEVEHIWEELYRGNQARYSRQRIGAGIGAGYSREAWRRG